MEFCLERYPQYRVQRPHNKEAKHIGCLQIDPSHQTNLAKLMVAC
jgi:hypothetical protein